MNFLPLWLFFVVGQALHVLKRADLSVHSTATAGSSWRDWFQRNWVNVLVRAFGCSLMFMLWLATATGGTVFGRLLADVGGGFIAKYLPVPAVSLEALATAGVFGFGADSALDYLIAKFRPTSQKELPAPDAMVQQPISK